jgi:hypothetical protein
VDQGAGRLCLEWSDAIWICLHNNLLVSEAFAGAANASAISSYDFDDKPLSLESISASVPAHQTAACWVVLARHGRYAYITNTGSGNGRRVQG